MKRVVRGGGCGVRRRQSSPPTRANARVLEEMRAIARAFGRISGVKGPARAAKMTKKQRSESAKKAAAAQWKKSTGDR